MQQFYRDRDFSYSMQEDAEDMINTVREKLETIYRFNEHRNLNLGVMADCAIDNAGFDGMGNVLAALDDAAISEIYRHLESIVDANMTDCCPEDLALAREVFKG
jgi:hypothetical protein